MRAKIFLFLLVGTAGFLTSASAQQATPHISAEEFAAMTPEQREKVKEERKAKREAWLKAHPEYVQQMKDRRAKREQWLKDHPEEAKKMRERMKNRHPMKHQGPPIPQNSPTTSTTTAPTNP